MKRNIMLLFWICLDFYSNENAKTTSFLLIECEFEMKRETKQKKKNMKKKLPIKELIPMFLLSFCENFNRFRSSTVKCDSACKDHVENDQNKHISFQN